MLPRQTMRVEHCHKRVRVELFEIKHTRLHPCAVQHQCRANHCRYTGCISDSLRANLSESRLMVADVIQVDRARRAVLRAANNIANTGFALCGFAQITRIGQHGF